MNICWLDLFFLRVHVVFIIFPICSQKGTQLEVLAGPGRGQWTLPSGWMSAFSAYAVAALSEVQRGLYVSGGVGEIGVHHGLFFLALAHTAGKHERLFACDVFQDQHLNVDSSGHGDRSIFEQNLKTFGVDPGTASIFQGESASLTPGKLRDWGVAPFRLLSIDGGHNAPTVLSDLLLAEAVIVRGGIVVLDDFNNDDWLGVREGYYMYALGSNEKVSV